MVQYIPSLMNPQHSRAGHIYVLMPLRSNLRSNRNMFEWMRHTKAHQRTWYRFIWIKYSFLNRLKMLIISLKFHNDIITVIYNCIIMTSLIFKPKINDSMHTSVQIWELFYVFERSVSCSPRLLLYVQKYSNIVTINIVQVYKQYCSGFRVTWSFRNAHSMLNYYHLL